MLICKRFYILPMLFEEEEKNPTLFIVLRCLFGSWSLFSCEFSMKFSSHVGDKQVVGIVERKKEKERII